MKQKSVLKQITKSREFSLVIVLIVLCVVATILNPSFISPTNIAQIFRNNALTYGYVCGNALCAPDRRY